MQPSSTRGRASVFDVAPTVAALLGLPVDRREQGGPIRAAFLDLPTPPRKDLANVPVRRLAADPMSENEASEYSKKLMALGYLSGGGSGRVAPSDDKRPGPTETGWNNLGLYQATLGGPTNLAAAEAAYGKALALWPEYSAARFNLALLQRLRGDDRRAVKGSSVLSREGRRIPNERSSTGRCITTRRRTAASGVTRCSRRGAKQYPDSESVQRAHALVLFQDKDCRRADASLEVASRRPSRDTLTLNALALIRELPRT